MRRFAITIIRIFLVASPYHTSVTAIRVPNLRTVKTATFATDDFGCEYIAAVIAFSQFFSPCHFRLHQFKFLWWNNSRVALFYIVLRDLTLIHFGLFRKKINSKFLLQQSRTLVFFICQNAFHRTEMPLLFPRWCWNAFFNQNTSDFIWRHALHKPAINTANDFCLLRHNFRQAICSFSIPQKMLVW